MIYITDLSYFTQNLGPITNAPYRWCYLCFGLRPEGDHSFKFSIQTETNLVIQVKEAAEKATEEYRRDHPDADESAIKADLPEAQKAQGQAVVAPGFMPNMYLPMGYPVYNLNPNPIVGQAQVYPHVQLPFPPQPQHVPAKMSSSSQSQS